MTTQPGHLNHAGVETPSIAASIDPYRNRLGATAIGEPLDPPAHPAVVTPAKAGPIFPPALAARWIPAVAGMTVERVGV